MARQREFDVDVATDAVMRTFWSKGYEGTSLSDLTEACGVGRQSLYLALGNKESLYLAALDRYRERFAAPMAEAIAGSTDVRVCLREALLPIVDGTCTDQPSGCLTVSAASERAGTDPAVRRRVLASFRALEGALLEGGRSARDAGLVAEDVDLPGWAALTVATIQGLQVLAAAGTERTTMIRALDTALAVLRP